MNIFATAKKFAIAIYECAGDDVRERWQGLLRAGSLIAKEKKTKKLLNTPKLTGEERLNVFVQIFEQTLKHPLTGGERNFIRLTLLSGFFQYFRLIEKAYRNHLQEQSGCQHLTFKSAYALNDQKALEVQKWLEKKHQKQVALNQEVEDSLIGGGVVVNNDRVVDYSTKGRLDALEDWLSNS